jgi:DNA-binding beta-propeller fold protein YncE
VGKITHHPLRPLLYASGGAGVLELDPESGEIIRRFPGGVESHALTPDGARVYTVDRGGGISAWNLETGVRERSFPDVYGTDLAISPDGRFLYVLYGSNHIVDGSRVYIVDRTSGARLRTVILGGLARRIAMSHDGIAIISNEGGEVGWVDFVR